MDVTEQALVHCQSAQVLLTGRAHYNLLGYEWISDWMLEWLLKLAKGRPHDMLVAELKQTVVLAFCH